MDQAGAMYQLKKKESPQISLNQPLEYLPLPMKNLSNFCLSDDATRDTSGGRMQSRFEGASSSFRRSARSSVPPVHVPSIHRFVRSFNRRLTARSLSLSPTKLACRAAVCFNDTSQGFYIISIASLLVT